MAPDRIHFAEFTLDPQDRRLSRAGATVELGSRYFDALLLLLSDAGALVSKDRFMARIWDGVPVTDEALTQCIRTLRRQLGDDAARPRFIETVPKHGYRFIGQVRVENGPAASRSAPALPAGRRWSRFALLGAAAMAGGGFAGIAGGLLYGFAVNMEAARQTMGATSVLFVLLAINMAVGLVAGAGVGFGMSAALSFAPDRRWYWAPLGGALGGLLVGAITRLVGLDALSLFLGRQLTDMTGAAEGMILGAAAGFGMWLADRQGSSLKRHTATGALLCGMAGLAVALSGGRLLGGSLDLLLHQFPDARLRLDAIGSLFGEIGFGPVSHIATSVIEAAIFGACLLGALFLARQALEPGGQTPSRTPS